MPSAEVAPDPVLDEVIESTIRFFQRRPLWRDHALDRHLEGIDGRCVEGCRGTYPCLSAYAAGQALRRSKHRIPQQRKAPDARLVAEPARRDRQLHPDQPVRTPPAGPGGDRGGGTYGNDPRRGRC